jgi:hypothetical protein
MTQASNWQRTTWQLHYNQDVQESMQEGKLCSLKVQSRLPHSKLGTAMDDRHPDDHPWICYMDGYGYGYCMGDIHG